MAVRGYDFTSDQKFEESCGFPTEHFWVCCSFLKINVHKFESCLWSIIKENNPPSRIFYIYSTHNFTNSWMINYSSFIIQFASINGENILWLMTQ